MRATVSHTARTFCLLAFLSTQAFGQSASLNSYQRAIQAINKGDCLSAVIELEKFKIEAKSQLMSHPDFLALVEKQITECKPKIGKVQPALSLRGITVDGMVKPDEKRFEDLRGNPGSVRFEGF